MPVESWLFINGVLKIPVSLTTMTTNMNALVLSAANTLNLSLAVLPIASGSLLAPRRLLMDENPNKLIAVGKLLLVMDILLSRTSLPNSLPGTISRLKLRLSVRKRLGSRLLCMLNLCFRQLANCVVSGIVFSSLKKIKKVLQEIMENGSAEKRHGQLSCLILFCPPRAGPLKILWVVKVIAHASAYELKEPDQETSCWLLLVQQHGQYELIDRHLLH